MHADFHEARLYSTEDKFEESLDRFDQMLTKYRQDLKHPDSRYLYEEIQVRRGLALSRLERCLEALPLLHEAESFELSTEDRSNLYCHIGHCHHRLREDDLALPYFLNARNLGLSKDWPVYFHYDLGYVYYRLRNYREAKREFTACEDQIKSGLPAPPAAQVYQMLAYVAQALGERAESERYSAMVRPS
jgi:tetratricopeptide (TPR) repeat protein